MNELASRKLMWTALSYSQELHQCGVADEVLTRIAGLEVSTEGD
jgi:hypothetical protein